MLAVQPLFPAADSPRLPLEQDREGAVIHERNFHLRVRRRMQPYRMPEGKHIGLQVLTFSLVTAGFFAVHSAAAGSLNRKLAEGRGRANSLYVLFYYLGGWVGITASGRAYQFAGWRAVAGPGGGT
jgi:hypothetical protein